MKTRLFLGTMAVAAIAFTASNARATESTTTSVTKDVKSVSVPGATVVVPGTEAGVNVDGTTTTTEGGATVTTTTTTTDTTTTATEAPKPPVVPIATPEVPEGGVPAVDTHGEKAGDEATDAGDKAAKAVTPLEQPAVPTPAGSTAEGNAKVEEHLGVKAAH